MQPLSGLRPFYRAHAIMAFAAAGRPVATRRVFGLLQRKS
jgi:hypothetical protein